VKRLVDELSVGGKFNYLSTKYSVPSIAQILLLSLKISVLTVAHMTIVLQRIVKYRMQYTL
jgi:hypothetical protein